MGQTRTHRFLQSAALSLLGSAAVLLLTHGGYRPQIDLTAATFLCFIVVLLVSLGGHFLPAAFVSIVALLPRGYFFIPPLFSIRVAHPIDEIAVIAFLANRTGHQRSGGQAAPVVQRGADPEPTPATCGRQHSGAGRAHPTRWLRPVCQSTLAGGSGSPVRGGEGLGLDSRESIRKTGTRFVGRVARGPVERGAAGVGNSHTAADGEYRWIWNRVVAVRDGQGNIVNWYQ